MYNVLIDENGYWNGMACRVGRFENGVDVQSIPTESDPNRQKAYKYKANQWVFDEIKYRELLTKANSLEKESKLNEQYLLNKKRLNSLSEDIIQSFTGIYIPNLEEKKVEFRSLLNQVRLYEGKSPKLIFDEINEENK